MTQDDITRAGRTPPAMHSRSSRLSLSNSRHRDSASAQTRHILYADGDVRSTASVEAILHQVDASVVHARGIAHCLARIDSGNCQLIVINLPRPEVEGMDLLAEARCRAPWIPTIVLVDRGQVDVAVRAIKAGAADCLERPPQPYCLRSAVVKALRESRRSVDSPPLTPVELDVLHHFLRGCNNREIAAALNRSSRTIEVHRSNIMRKLGADGPVDMVRRAITAGLADAFLSSEQTELPAPRDAARPSDAGRPARDSHADSRRHARSGWEKNGTGERVEVAAHRLKRFTAH